MNAVYLLTSTTYLPVMFPLSISLLSSTTPPSPTTLSLPASRSSLPPLASTGPYLLQVDSSQNWQKQTEISQ